MKPLSVLPARKPVTAHVDTPGLRSLPSQSREELLEKFGRLGAGQLVAVQQADRVVTGRE